MTLCRVLWCRWRAANRLKSAEHLPQTRCSRGHRHRPQPTVSLPSTRKLCSTCSRPRQPCCCYSYSSPTTRKKFETFFSIFCSFSSILFLFFTLRQLHLFGIAFSIMFANVTAHWGLNDELNSCNLQFRFHFANFATARRFRWASILFPFLSGEATQRRLMISNFFQVF